MEDGDTQEVDIGKALELLQDTDWKERPRCVLSRSDVVRPIVELLVVMMIVDSELAGLVLLVMRVTVLVSHGVVLVYNGFL